MAVSPDSLWDCSSFSCYNPLTLLRVPVRAVSDLTNAALITRSPSSTTCVWRQQRYRHILIQTHTHTHCGIMQTEASKYAITVLSIYLKDLMGSSSIQWLNFQLHLCLAEVNKVHTKVFKVLFISTKEHCPNHFSFNRHSNFDFFLYDSHYTRKS